MHRFRQDSADSGVGLLAQGVAPGCPQIHVSALPAHRRFAVDGPAGERRKSRRRGLRELFGHEGLVYKVYDSQSPYFHRAARIARSYPLVCRLAREVPGVAAMAGVIVEGEVGRERVVGYFMPWIPGRAIAEKAPEEIAACRALFLEIDRTLVAWGWYWQDPKLSNFVFDERHSRLRAVDLKQIRRLHSPVFDPDRMEGSPRRRKLEALQLSPGDYDDMAQRRRESWSALRGLPVDPATAAGAG